MNEPAYAGWRVDPDQTKVFHYNEDNNTGLSTVVFDNLVGAGKKDLEFFTNGGWVFAQNIDCGTEVAATTLHDTPEAFEAWARMVVAMHNGS